MKRRDFVIKSSLIATGVLTTSIAQSNTRKNIININNTINIGVIGTGDRGSGLISIINKIDGVEVIACCDVIPFRLENGISKAVSKVKKYNNHLELLADKEVDAVIIATPTNTHSQIAIDALNSNKHVYCEKTMAMGYNGIQNLVDKVKASKKVFQTGHQYHSSRLYSQIVESIKKGEIGKITAFECQWNRNGNWRRPVPKPELERAINWRMYREYSGGLVAELCSHQIDFVNWVLEAMPEKVYGTGGVDYWKDGRETYDNVHLIFNYPKGVKAKFTCLTSNAKDDYLIKIFGDKGTITLGYDKAWIYPENNHKKEYGEVDGVSGATIAWNPNNGIPIKVEHNDPSKQALIDFKDNIINNRNPVSNILTGANTAICVQMALDSMRNNKIIYKQKSYKI